MSLQGFEKWLYEEKKDLHPAGGRVYMINTALKLIEEYSNLGIEDKK